MFLSKYECFIGTMIVLHPSWWKAFKKKRIILWNFVSVCSSYVSVYSSYRLTEDGMCQYSPVTGWLRFVSPSCQSSPSGRASRHLCTQTQLCIRPGSHLSTGGTECLSLLSRIMLPFCPGIANILAGSDYQELSFIPLEPPHQLHVHTSEMAACWPVEISCLCQPARQIELSDELLLPSVQSLLNSQGEIYELYF